MEIITNKEIPKPGFNKEVLQHTNNLYTFALLITGEESKAEKVLKNTYSKAFWFYPYLSPETDIKFWLQRIMMNIFTNTIAPDEKSSPKTDEPLLPGIDPDLFEKRRLFEIREMLIKKISLLPTDMKNVLILKEVLGYSIGETGDLVDIPDGTVSKRLFDARRSLFLILEKDTANQIIASPTHIEYEDKKLIASIADRDESNEKNSQNEEKFKEEIEAQQFIKSLIKNHLPVQQVRDAVTLKIVKKFAPELKAEFKLKAGSENRKVMLGATITVVILLIIMIIVTRPDVVNPAEFASLQKGNNNAFLILKDNYINFINGDYDNAIIRASTDSLRGYLAGHGVNEKSFIKGFPGWKFSSLFFTEQAGGQILHCVYENDTGNSIFSSQFPLKSFKEDKALTLSQELFEYLVDGNCYSFRENETIYLLRIYGDYILGFAVNYQNNAVMTDICKQKPF